MDLYSPGLFNSALSVVRGCIVSELWITLVDNSWGIWDSGRPHRWLSGVSCSLVCGRANTGEYPDQERRHKDWWKNVHVVKVG